MNKNDSKMKLLGEVRVSKALLTLGLPTMIGMMINAIYNIVDAYFVGRLGTSEMGAISVAFPLGQIIVGIGLLFGNGAASYISRLLGRGDEKMANKVANTAIFSSITLGAIFILATLAFLRPILKVLGATDSILPYAMTYASIYIIGSILNIFNVTMNNIMTSEGAAQTTMFSLMTGAILNIILDPIFISVLNLGVAGAAIATVLSQLFSAMIYLLYVLQKKSIFHFHIKECCYSKQIMSEIMKIGIPTLLFQILTSLSITLIKKKAKVYGDSVIVSMGAVTRIMSMGSLMVFGFIKGFQPIAGYSYGAKKFDRLRKSINTCILWSTIFCIVYGVVLSLFSTPIISLFTKGDISLIETGQIALKANGLSFLLFGFSTVYSSLFLALGKAKEGLLLGACRQGICFIPVILLLPMFLGINGVLYAQPLADSASAIIATFMAIRLSRELAKNNSIII